MKWSGIPSWSFFHLVAVFLKTCPCCPSPALWSESLPLAAPVGKPETEKNRNWVYELTHVFMHFSFSWLKCFDCPRGFWLLFRYYICKHPLTATMFSVSSNVLIPPKNYDTHNATNTSQWPQAELNTHEWDIIRHAVVWKLSTTALGFIWVNLKQDSEENDEHWICWTAIMDVSWRHRPVSALLTVLGISVCYVGVGEAVL